MNAMFRKMALTVAVFGLFACNQSEKPSGPALEGTGSARVKLPTVPMGYVPDSVLDSSGHSVFLLSITGPDMSPIVKSWDLQPGGAEKATVTGIPVGWPRVFTGSLVWVTSWGDTLNTHEGRDSVAISRDSIAQVSLYLRKIGSSGSAEVCVEVEGWGADSTCVKPPHVTDLNGCWMIAVRDSLMTRYGALYIRQHDTSVFMEITWKNGQKDSSMGTLAHNVMYMGHPYGMPGFHFKGQVTDGGTRIVAAYRGDRDSMDLQLSAVRGPCDTIIVPPPVVPEDSLSGCFQVTQSMKGKVQSGNLRLKDSAGIVQGAFEWIGFSPMTVSGHFRTLPHNLDLELTGTAPEGMLDSAGQTADSLRYRAIMGFYPVSTLDGSVFRLQSDGWMEVGVWKAFRQSCPADSSRRR